jgi:hypothetical protein
VRGEVLDLGHRGIVLDSKRAKADLSQDGCIPDCWRHGLISLGSSFFSLDGSKGKGLIECLTRVSKAHAFMYQ